MRFWRRSIQVRVVISTMLLSALFIGATGWALMADVAESLAISRRDSAAADVRLATNAIQSRLDATDVATSRRVETQILNDAVNSIATVEPRARPYELVVEGPYGPSKPPQNSTLILGRDVIPPGLRAAVRRSNDPVARIITIPATDGKRQAVLVGQHIRATRTGHVFGAFYIFSLRDQVAALRLVRQALIFGGVASVLMIGGIAFLVSRQVLSPVRMARRIAEQYARGKLEQRMPVHGQDDIARLSTSFNLMATNLQAQIKSLERLSQLQQRFVSDVSHELRTPLTTVQMAGSMIFEHRDGFDPVAARSAELLKRELDRFENLLLQLLDLSRFDAGAAHVELETVDLVELARDEAEDPGFLGLPTEVVGDQSPALVEIDRRRISRILRNLLANAAKHSQSDRIELEVVRDVAVASLIVRDFGIGLTDDQLGHVFERFWRADPARTEGGTGLGLAIAWEDAALHSGSLTVQRGEAGGTEFVLTLPLVQTLETAE